MTPRGRKTQTTKNAHPDAAILIIGPNELQNELLCLHLVNEEGYNCQTSEELSLKDDNDDADVHLVLFDCLQNDPIELWPAIEKAEAELASLYIAALFNAKPEEGITREAMTRRARGVFYRGTSVAIMVKGIQAMLEGELWYSREALSHFLMEPKNKNQLPEEVAASLTPREREILIQIAGGSSNKEIAESLYISLHTVKSHIYNIYRKIGVPNRLRAAKWVAKHLKS